MWKNEDFYIEDGGFAGGYTADETDVDVVNRDLSGVHFIGIGILLSLKGSAIENQFFVWKNEGFYILRQRQEYAVDLAIGL